MTPPADARRRVQEIKDRCEKATKGPWVADDFCEETDLRTRVGTTNGTEHYYHESATVALCAYDDDEPPDERQIGQVGAEHNADFIAHAREDIPFLLQLVADLDRARPGGVETDLKPIPSVWAEAANAARGLCESEARRWEEASPKTAEHWRTVAMHLGALYLTQDHLAARSLPPPPASGWHDISSAPKDGTRILAIDGQSICIVSWEAGYSDKSIQRFEDSGGFERRATHWMPLPDPPSADRQETTEEIIEIDEDGKVSRPVRGPIRESGERKK